eukprot:6539744-Prymnesium_polylepis.1
MALLNHHGLVGDDAARALMLWARSSPDTCCSEILSRFSSDPRKVLRTSEEASRPSGSGSVVRSALR